MRYATAYEVTRHFGGPEEGGWWYNWHEVIESIPAEEEHAEAVGDGLADKYSHLNYGDIYSVNGGALVSVIVEDVPGENRDIERPRYE